MLMLHLNIGFFVVVVIFFMILVFPFVFFGSLIVTFAMCMSTVSVKWQKELFKDVEIDTSQPPYVFKCQLYDLTGVPPERQKIMVKGGLLKVSK
jgi:hypothetical protein